MTHEPEQENDGPAYQAVVYFNEFPEFDGEEIAALIDNLDEEEEELAEVIKGEDSNENGLRLASWSIQLGELSVILLVHGVPSPTPYLIEQSRLQQELKEDLLAHKSFVLVNVFGGEDLVGVEKVILLHKVALALTQLGATGMTLLTNEMTYPAGLLHDIINSEEEGYADDDEEGEGSFEDQIARLAAEGNPVASMMQQVLDATRNDPSIPIQREDPAETEADPDREEEGDEDDEEYEEVSESVFSALRHAGEPFELLASIELISAEDAGLGDADARVLISRGFAQCGVPDMIYVSRDPDEDLNEVAALFRSGFHYMMENGPVIEPGHSMGSDERVQFRFEEVPAEISLPFETWEMLHVVRG
ncbi:DUF4261 domain-containing protein [bacterium]|nr:DUF4261 domain-containing protein [bacterium]